MVQGRALAILPGERFGQLTVIAIKPGNGYGPRRVECRCECGEIYLAIPHRLQKGETVRCFGCMPKRRTAEHIQFRRRLNNYENNAKQKNLFFNFNAEEFRKFYEAICIYCGLTPARGIDRKDNSLGYVEGNCVPACAQCNYAKRNATEQDFLAWVARIAAKQGFSL